MECPVEMKSTLIKYGWYERGNGTWSHEKDGHKHRAWDEAIRAFIEVKSMNRTRYGNIAVGSEGSTARMESDIAFLSEKLRLMEFAADELRDHFVPNDERHSAVMAYNEAKNFKG